MKEKTLGEFIFENLNPFTISAIKDVCNGCKKRFASNKLFQAKKATEWLCDDCLKEKEEGND